MNGVGLVNASLLVGGDEGPRKNPEGCGCAYSDDADVVMALEVGSLLPFPLLLLLYTIVGGFTMGAEALLFLVSSSRMGGERHRR